MCIYSLIIPRPLFPTIFIFHLVFSPPPNHCTPIHHKQDKHYLMWNSMNIKWLDHADWTTVSFASVISPWLSVRSNSSMIKRSVSSISHADESCFLTLIRALRGLAMGAEEHLHGRSGSGITEKDLIRVIMQEYFWLFKIGHSRQKEKENSSQEHTVKNVFSSCTIGIQQIS